MSQDAWVKQQTQQSSGDRHQTRIKTSPVSGSGNCEVQESVPPQPHTASFTPIMPQYGMPIHGSGSMGRYAPPAHLPMHAGSHRRPAPPKPSPSPSPHARNYRYDYLIEKLFQSSFSRFLVDVKQIASTALIFLIKSYIQTHQLTDATSSATLTSLCQAHQKNILKKKRENRLVSEFIVRNVTQLYLKYLCPKPVQNKMRLFYSSKNKNFVLKTVKWTQKDNGLYALKV